MYLLLWIKYDTQTKNHFIIFSCFKVTYIIITLTTPTRHKITAGKTCILFKVAKTTFFHKLLSRRKLSVTIWKIPPKKFPYESFVQPFRYFTHRTHDIIIHFLVCKNTMSKLQRISRLCFFLTHFIHLVCYTRLWLTKDKKCILWQWVVL